MAKATAKQTYWSEHLVQAEAFSGSLAEYAQAQNIPVQTLYRWRHYFKDLPAADPNTQPLFTQVLTAPVSAVCITLQMSNIQLQFTRLPDPQWLAQLMAASCAP
ncbi:MAG: hypothetical protein KBT88_06025 [Gammaproteobacteria bacterium]|nr:hypothetical protein [Gammaproteobacteria bacterium]MBQ0839326.1 hypothetical protein [Gammaproteobacteria bacterium]